MDANLGGWRDLVAHFGRCKPNLGRYIVEEVVADCSLYDSLAHCTSTGCNLGSKGPVWNSSMGHAHEEAAYCCAVDSFHRNSSHFDIGSSPSKVDLDFLAVVGMHCVGHQDTCSLLEGSFHIEGAQLGYHMEGLLFHLELEPAEPEEEYSNWLG